MLVAGIGCGQNGPASDADTGGTAESAERLEHTPEAGDGDTAARPTPETHGGSVAQSIEDVSLAARVQLAIVNNRDLRPFEIEPSAENGSVVLRGHVETLTQRRLAETIAANVGGVGSVINEITSTEEQPLPRGQNRGTASDISSRPSHGGPSEAAGAAQVDGVSGADGLVGAGETESGSGAELTYHTVTSGDNLWDIARAYGVSIEQIRQTNQLESNSLRPGQRLRIP